MQKAKDKYHNSGGKKEASEYYIEKKRCFFKKAKNKYKNFSKEEKEAKREYSRNKYKNMKENMS